MADAKPTQEALERATTLGAACNSGCKAAFVMGKTGDEPSY